MFEIEFRPRRRSDARSERCSFITVSWFPAAALIALVFVFAGRIWGSLVTVIVILFMLGFSWYYFQSAPPEIEPDLGVPAEANIQIGLSQIDITTIPQFAYERNSESNGVGWMQCVVCIVTVKEGEMVRRLPICKHTFHVECIDAWLGSNSTCPLCRADVKSGDTSFEPTFSLV